MTLPVTHSDDDDEQQDNIVVIGTAGLYQLRAMPLLEVANCDDLIRLNIEIS